MDGNIQADIYDLKKTLRKDIYVAAFYMAAMFSATLGAIGFVFAVNLDVYPAILPSGIAILAGLYFVQAGKKLLESPVVD